MGLAALADAYRDRLVATVDGDAPAGTPGVDADRRALKSMLFGRISRAWARHHAPAWLDELSQEERGPAEQTGR